MDRGERRHQLARNKARWLRYWKRSAGYKVQPDEQWLARTVRISAAHGTLCSCYMCGNPRRHFGELTIQERRADSAALKDY